MRKLATRRVVSDVRPIEGADNIELCVLDGWQVVTKKGDFQPQDDCIYFEIDAAFKAESLIGRSLDPARLTNIYTDDGQQFQGFRIRTIKLRGQISQGYILPLSYFDGVNVDLQADDLAPQLEVYKFEKPVQADNGNMPVRCAFPGHLQKTDQERIQNLVAEVYQAYVDNHISFEVSYKLEGTSMTVSRFEQEEHVCSRNLSYLLDQPVDTAPMLSIGKDILAKIQGDFTVQGELVGPGIQGNFEKVAQASFYMFSLFDPKQRCYVTPRQAREFAVAHDINHVPVLHEAVTLQQLFGAGLDQDGLLKALLAYADGPSGLKGAYREGLVYKAEQTGFSFKTISNKYLLKQE